MSEMMVTKGNHETATLSLKEDGLWLTLSTPVGYATYNLEYVLKAAGYGKLVFSDRKTIRENVTEDYFKRIES